MVEGSYRLSSSSSELRAEESRTGRTAALAFLLRHRITVGFINNFFFFSQMLPDDHSAPSAGKIREQHAFPMFGIEFPPWCMSNALFYFDRLC